MRHGKNHDEHLNLFELSLKRTHPYLGDARATDFTTELLKSAAAKTFPHFRSYCFRDRGGSRAEVDDALQVDTDYLKKENCPVWNRHSRSVQCF